MSYRENFAERFFFIYIFVYTLHIRCIAVLKFNLSNWNYAALFFFQKESFPEK